MSEGRNGLICQQMTTGEGIKATLTITHHVPVHWRCNCGKVTTLCRLCEQPLQRDRYGRWASLPPHRINLIWVGYRGWFKERRYLWAMKLAMREARRG